MSINFNEYHYLPPGFLDCNAKSLYKVIPGPSLIHLKGKKEQPVFVSILLHGNETVGLKAIQRLLKAYQDEDLPRSLSIFVGNVDAAAQGLRRLDYQPDYNRMWPRLTEEVPLTAEAALMQQVTDKMRENSVFASIDLHNNTGLNPHYACINKLDNRFFHLANLFSQTVVYFLQPEGVQSAAMAEICPAVTLECGHVDDESGVEHAFEYLDACIQLSEIPETPLAKGKMNLFHTVATVKVPEEFDFSYSDSTKDIYFNPELETYNFRELEENTFFALTHPDKDIKLSVTDERGENVVEKYFSFDNNEIRTRHKFMPSMITSNEKVIRQDCLCYLMERYPW